jgi:hypothetical protein
MLCRLPRAAVLSVHDASMNVIQQHMLVSVHSCLLTNGFNLLSWRYRACSGLGLEKGQVIVSGAIAKTRDFKAGNTVEITMCLADGTEWGKTIGNMLP